jgi:ABC-type dipeptide/oligopeptide/nickel transport system ATPase component
MNLGRVVEIGETAAVFGNPQYDYTKALLAAHPRADVASRAAATGPPGFVDGR